MKAVQSLSIAFALVTCTAAKCCPDMCPFDDEQCMTRGANDFFTAVISGKDGLNDPMDPLNIQRIDGKKGLTEYTLTNIKVRGLSQCIVTKLKLKITNQEYDHYVHCSNLTATFYYLVNGQSHPQKVTLISHNYKVLNLGQYGIFVSPLDFQAHFFIQSVYTKVYIKNEINIKNDTMSFLFFVVMKRCMRIALAGIDAYFETHLLGEAFPITNQASYLNGRCA